jgi:uncharacterized protein YndB with AHSA1/START domain
MDINRNAPVIAESEIEIDAEPESVWHVIVDVERWPQWNHEVKSVVLQGGIQEGSVFRWKTSSGPIASTFQEIEPPRIVAWTGRAMSIKAVHRWNLERTNGKTTVKTAESFDGAISRLFRRPLQKALKKSLDEGLEALKAEVERHPA